MRRPELGRQLAHQLAEVDAAVGREVEDQPRSVEHLLDARQLHRRARARGSSAARCGTPRARAAACFSRATTSSRVATRTTRCGESAGGRRRSASCGIDAHDGADRRTAVGLHDDAIARPRRRVGRQIAEQEGLRPADRRELDRDEPSVGRSRRITSGQPVCGSPVSSSQLQLQHQPVGHDLDAGVPLQRHERPIDRRKRAHRRARRRYARASRSSAGRTSGLASARGVRARLTGARRRAAATPSRAGATASCSRSPRRRRRSSPADPSRLRSAAADRLSPPRAPAPARPRRAPRRVAGARLERAPEAAVGRRRHRARLGLAVPARTSAAAMSSATSGRNRSRGQRDRTVGSSTSGRAVTRMKTDDGGGSSSVFSSAFCAGGTSASASSMMTTRRRPSNGRYAARSIDVAHLLDLDRAAVARLDDEDVGMDAARDARAGGARRRTRPTSSSSRSRRTSAERRGS